MMVGGIIDGRRRRGKREKGGEPVSKHQIQPDVENERTDDTGRDDTGLMHDSMFSLLKKRCNMKIDLIITTNCPITVCTVVVRDEHFLIIPVPKW